MIVVTIGSAKGGVGKSTIALNLAVEAALEKKRTLLVDSDAQASAMAFRAIREKDDIQVISILTATLHKDLKDFVSSFDVCIIDAGGRDTNILRSAMLACDALIIPVQPSQFDIWASADTIQVLSEARVYREIPAFFVVNGAITGTKIAREAVEAIQEFAKDAELLDTIAHNRVAFKNSVAGGQGVSEYERDGKAAQETRDLYKEIMTKVGRTK